MSIIMTLRKPGLTHVVGRWGDGTSLVAEIVRRHNHYFGQHDTPGVGGCDPKRARNKWGNMEDQDTLLGVQNSNAMRAKAGLRKIKLEAARTNRIAGVKCPWVLVRPDMWELLEEEGVDRVVWVRRPEKEPHEYTMLPDMQDEAETGFQILQHRWKDTPGFTITYQELLTEPERTIRRLAVFLEQPFNSEAVAAVDRSWPRYWREPCEH